MAGTGTVELTEQEQEILRLLAWNNRQIALWLGMKHQTARNILTQLNKKVLGSGVTAKHTRIQLLLAALRGGHLELAEVSAGPIRF